MHQSTDDGDGRSSTYTIEDTAAVTFPDPGDTVSDVTAIEITVPVDGNNLSIAPPTGRAPRSPCCG